MNRKDIKDLIEKDLDPMNPKERNYSRIFFKFPIDLYIRRYIELRKKDWMESGLHHSIISHDDRVERAKENLSHYEEKLKKIQLELEVCPSSLIDFLEKQRDYYFTDLENCVDTIENADQRLDRNKKELDRIVEEMTDILDYLRTQKKLTPDEIISIINLEGRF